MPPYAITIYHYVNEATEDEAQELAAEMAAVLCQYAAVCNATVEVECQE